MKKCCDCRWYREAPAGPEYDRCENPQMVDQDDGDSRSGNTFSNIRIGNNPRCYHLRRFFGACGVTGAYWESKTAQGEQ